MKEMTVKSAAVIVLAIVFSLAALAWLEPATNGGAALVVIVCLAVATLLVTVVANLLARQRTKT